jgi:hypothetical protein
MDEALVEHAGAKELIAQLEDMSPDDEALGIQRPNLAPPGIVPLARKRLRRASHTMASRYDTDGPGARESAQTPPGQAVPGCQLRTWSVLRPFPEGHDQIEVVAVRQVRNVRLTVGAVVAERFEFLLILVRADDHDVRTDVKLTLF